jgi:hypothetical protein
VRFGLPDRRFEGSGRIAERVEEARHVFIANGPRDRAPQAIVVASAHIPVTVAVDVRDPSVVAPAGREGAEPSVIRARSPHERDVVDERVGHGGGGQGEVLWRSNHILASYWTTPRAAPAQEEDAGRVTPDPAA